MGEALGQDCLRKSDVLAHHVLEIEGGKGRGGTPGGGPHDSEEGGACKGCPGGRYRSRVVSSDPPPEGELIQPVGLLDGVHNPVGHSVLTGCPEGTCEGEKEITQLFGVGDLCELNITLEGLHQAPQGITGLRRKRPHPGDENGFWGAAQGLGLHKET